MTQNYRGLKTAVIVMGVMLVVGTAVLIAGLVRQAQRIGEAFDTPAVAWDLVLPPEHAGKIVQMSQADGRLSLLIERDGRRHIAVVDIASGNVVGTISPEPDAEQGKLRDRGQ